MVPSDQLQDHLIDNANYKDKVVDVYQLKMAVFLLFLHEFISCGTHKRDVSNKHSQQVSFKEYKSRNSDTLLGNFACVMLSADFYNNKKILS